MNHKANLRRKSLHRKRRATLGYATLVILVLGLCYLFVWQRVKTLDLADERSQRQKSVNALKEKCRGLEYQIEELSSMTRIREIALNDLSLLPLSSMKLATSAKKRHPAQDITKAAKKNPELKQISEVVKTPVRKGKR